MKSTKKRNTKIVIVLAIIFVFAASASYYVLALNGAIFGWQLRKDSSSVDLQPPTEEEKEAGRQVKEDVVEKAEGKPTNSDIPSSGSSSTIVAGFSAINQNDDALQIRTIIQEVLSSGSCIITLKKDNQTVTKTTSVYPNASISTCQGFDIPTSELSPGTWDITIKVTSDNRDGSATTTTQIN